MRLAIRQMRFVREMPVALARMFSPGSTSMRARASMGFFGMRAHNLKMPA